MRIIQRSCTSAPSLAWLALLALGCNRPTDMGKFANIGAAEKIRTALVGDAAAADEGEAASTGTGWATIKGRFV
jgi:hypothetical protein